MITSQIYSKECRSPQGLLSLFSFFLFNFFQGNFVGFYLDKNVGFYLEGLLISILLSITTKQTPLIDNQYRLGIIYLLETTIIQSQRSVAYSIQVDNKLSATIIVKHKMTASLNTLSAQKRLSYTNYLVVLIATLYKQLQRLNTVDSYYSNPVTVITIVHNLQLTCNYSISIPYLYSSTDGVWIATIVNHSFMQAMNPIYYYYSITEQQVHALEALIDCR